MLTARRRGRGDRAACARRAAARAAPRPPARGASPAACARRAGSVPRRTETTIGRQVGARGDQLVGQPGLQRAGAHAATRPARSPARRRTRCAAAPRRRAGSARPRLPRSMAAMMSCAAAAQDVGRDAADVAERLAVARRALGQLDHATGRAGPSRPAGPRARRCARARRPARGRSRARAGPARSSAAAAATPRRGRARRWRRRSAGTPRAPTRAGPSRQPRLDLVGQRQQVLDVLGRVVELLLGQRPLVPAREATPTSSAGCAARRGAARGSRPAREKPAKPAATCVSKTLVTSVSQQRRSSATSWRPAWRTISTSGSARHAASGAGSNSGPPIGSRITISSPDDDLHQAQQRPVAALGHELGVDPEAALRAGAVCQCGDVHVRAHPSRGGYAVCARGWRNSTSTACPRSTRASSPRRARTRTCTSAASCCSTGPPPHLDEFLDHVRARLHLVPRYRQKIAKAPLETGLPLWIDDPTFNLGYHVRHTALPAPGDQDALMTLAARVFSQRLDRSKPLWELYLVEGLDDGRFALISKTHHALVDGVSGADLATVLFDLVAGGHRRCRRPSRGSRSREPTRAELVARGVEGAARTRRRARRRCVATPPRARSLEPRARARRGRRRGRPHRAEGAARRRRSTSRPARTGASASSRSELARFKTIKDALGGTVNDVVLTAVVRRARPLPARARPPHRGHRAARVRPGVRAHRRHEGDDGQRDHDHDGAAAGRHRRPAAAPCPRAPGR